MPDDPALPFPPPFAPSPTVNVSVAGSRVIGSGTTVMLPTQTIIYAIADLVFQVKFADDGGDHSFDSRSVDAKTVEITLRNFKNALGTVLNPVQCGTIAGEPLYIALFVEDVADKLRVVSHTFSLGGAHGA